MNPRIKLFLSLAVIFGIALFLRAGRTEFQEPLSPDETEYHNLAVRFLEGRSFVNETGSPTAWRTPGFPVILAGIYQLGGVNPNLALWVLIVLSSLAPLVLYALVYLLFKRESVALTAAALYAVLPAGIFFSKVFFGESVAVLMLMLAFLSVLVSMDKGRVFYPAGIMVAGFLIGSAILTRGYLVFVILALPLFLLTFKRSKKAAVFCLLISSLLPLFWILRNYSVLGSLTLSTETAQVVWHGNNQWSHGGWNGEWFNENSVQKAFLLKKYPDFFERPDEVEKAKIYQTETLAEVRENPGRILGLLPRKLAVFLTPTSYIGFDWVYLFCLPFAAIGFFLLLRNPEQRNYLWLSAFPVIGIAAICLLTFGDTRFRHPVDFCFMILGSLGLHWAGGKLKKRLIPVQYN